MLTKTKSYEQRLDEAVEINESLAGEINIFEKAISNAKFKSEIKKMVITLNGNNYFDISSLFFKENVIFIGMENIREKLDIVSNRVDSLKKKLKQIKNDQIKKISDEIDHRETKSNLKSEQLSEYETESDFKGEDQFWWDDKIENEMEARNAKCLKEEVEEVWKIFNIYLFICLIIEFLKVF